MLYACYNQGLLQCLTRVRWYNVTVTNFAQFMNTLHSCGCVGLKCHAALNCNSPDSFGMSLSDGQFSRHYRHVYFWDGFVHCHWLASKVRQLPELFGNFRSTTRLLLGGTVFTLDAARLSLYLHCLCHKYSQTC